MAKTVSVGSMNETLWSILACPSCGRALFGARDVIAPEPKALTCACGMTYPVIEGVPRLVETAPSAPTPLTLRQPQGETTGSGRGEADDYENIRRSFSQEWRIFDYDVDKTWGWTIEDRLRVFVGDVGFQAAALNGKRLLDAGCGNGTLTAALARFGMEIVGLDLNDHLATAHKNRERLSERALSSVRYVQGNLVRPPFIAGSFDLIYSSGVIHHTPSSEGTFDTLARLTKSGGRLYVWVYGKRPFVVQAFFTIGRRLKTVMSLHWVMRTCRVLAPLYGFAARLLNRAGVMQFRDRTSREITLDLFDAFAPRFNHQHTESQVRSWFESRGFRNITASGHQKHGFGMYGDRP
jgi:ubiquinone/menaquinone biosynthesis C-methylase UbiE/uncharacterized protein YbaR (Trm112 family)